MNELKEELLTALREYVGDNEESTRKMVNVLLKNLPKNCEELLNSIKNQNLKEIKFYAHKTKYSFKILHMQVEMEKLQQVEKMTEETFDVFIAKRIYSEIEHKSNLICQELKEILKA